MMIGKIQEIENKFNELCYYMHDLYTKKYIKKTLPNNIRIVPEQYNVVKKCHSWHIETRLYVTAKKVYEILSLLSPSHLNKLLKSISLNLLVSSK